MSLPRKLVNFNLFLEGVGYAGVIPEFTLPKLGRETEDFRAGGMDGPVALDVGGIKLEGEFSTPEHLREALLSLGQADASGSQLRLRGAITRDDASNSTDALEVVIRGRFTEVDFDALKPGTVPMVKFAYTATYLSYRLNNDPTPLIEIDQIGMVYAINGNDRLAEQRAALGL